MVLLAAIIVHRFIAIELSIFFRFREPFDPVKLLLDLGLFALVYFGLSFLVAEAAKRRKRRSR